MAALPCLGDVHDLVSCNCSSKCFYKNYRGGEWEWGVTAKRYSASVLQDEKCSENGWWCWLFNNLSVLGAP